VACKWGNRVADIFLSYARTDAAKAERIARDLGKRGWSVWFDREIRAHESFADVIEVELEKARAVLVLWSAEAVESHWVRSEANRARELHKLVQARIGSARLPMPFDQVHCADLGERGVRSRRGWPQVVKALSEVIARAGGQPARAVHDSGRIARRHLIAGGGAAALLASGGFVAWRTYDRTPPLSPQAQLLLDRGMAALQDNDALDPQGPGSTAQAIALLTDATAAAPESATAWGALAMAYAVRKRVAPLSERSGLDLRSRSAAERALHLDDHEVRALGALRLIDPIYRDWLAVEKADRIALQKAPKFPILLFILSDMLGNVGRWKDAANYSRQFDRKKFLIPGADRKVIVDLWCSGDIQAADAALATAVERWPQHPQVWQTRLGYLLYSGRPGEALQMLGSGAERPIEITPEFVAAAEAIAAALVGRLARTSAITKIHEYLARNPAWALQAAQACTALGAADPALDILDGYYFGRGKWAAVAPAAGDADRITNRLFQPPMKLLWADPRFATLLQSTGLEDYWRRSGTTPDFRVAPAH